MKRKYIRRTDDSIHLKADLISSPDEVSEKHLTTTYEKSRQTCDTSRCTQVLIDPITK